MNAAPHRWFMWMVIGSLGGVACDTSAQDHGPADEVRFVERDIHIPAHPAPGDGSVPFRFKSGSTATFLARDEATGWLKVQGIAQDGSVKTGWVTRSYIAEPASVSVSEEEESPDLDWCPPKGKPQPARPGRLRIATWNIGNLHAVDGQSTYTGSRPSVKRQAKDYERIRCYIRMFDPDILAVQEVDGEAALQRVVDADVYDVHVSDRPRGSLNGRQNTGFAYKKGLEVQTREDVTTLDVDGNGRLRYGTRIDVTCNEHTIRLMSVHLKSGCFDNESDSDACEQLEKQIRPLEAWIDDAAMGAEPFIVLGDFNRRFNLPGDTVWQEIDDADPPNADLTTVTMGMPICCRDNQYTEFIDHIVLDKRAERWVDRTSFRHITYRLQDEPAWDRISDHCPVMVELWIE